MHALLQVEDHAYAIELAKARRETEAEGTVKLAKSPKSCKYPALLAVPYIACSTELPTGTLTALWCCAEGGAK